MWVTYDYSCWFDDSDGLCRCDCPIIEVELSYKDKDPIIVQGLIDSGCQMTNANAEIAEYFEIDPKKCASVTVSGASGTKGEGFKHNLNMRVDNFGDSFESPVIFTKDLPVVLLLGQDNFFDTFKVKFEKMNNTFELNRVN